jgi:hypothetical protein
MVTNHILEDKSRVQKELFEEAGQDPARYIALTHERALEVQERYGIKLRYLGMEVDLSEERDWRNEG